MASLKLWPEFLVHVSVAGVKWMSTHNNVEGLKCTSMAVKDICEPCVCGKAVSAPMPSASGVCVLKRLEFAHWGFGGPMPEPSRGVALHFLTFATDFSRRTVVAFLQKKSDLLADYKKWLTKARLHTGNKIMVSRSDNGGEYVSSSFKALQDESEETHQTTVPDTLQQKGGAESLIRDIVEMAHTILRQRDVDQELWANAIRTAA